MKPADIHPGLVLRVISHGIGAPIGTLATVKSVETSLSGDWVAMIVYDHTRQPRHGTRFYRSHLWTVDLAYFEIVNDVERTVVRQVSRAEARREARRAQLRLPLDESGPVD